MWQRLNNIWCAFRRRPWRSITILAVASLFCLVLLLAAAKAWAWHQFRQAEQAIELGDYKRAKEYLRQGLVFWPTNAQAHFWMARACRWQGDFDEAEDHLDRCEQLQWSPSALEVERILLRAHGGEFPRWEKTLNSLARAPSEEGAAVQEYLTYQYIQNSQHALCFHWGKRFLKTHPNHIGALRWMAFLYRRTSHREECLQCYQRALEIQPDNDETRKDYAETLLRLKQPREALQQYQLLESREPESVKVVAGLARCYRTLGEFARTRRLLLSWANRPMVNRETHFEVLSELAQLAWKEGRAREAEKWLRKAEALYAHSTTNLYTMYLCLQQQGKVQEAKRYHARLKKRNADVDRLDLLTRKLISKDPKNPDIPYEIGMICFRNEDLPNAVYWMKKTLELRPWHAGANLAMAKHYENQGNQELAATYRRQAQGLGWEGDNRPMSPFGVRR